MRMDDFFQRVPRKAALSFAIGISCFAVAWGMVSLFSGRFRDVPSGMEAGPSLSLRKPVPLPEPPASAEVSPAAPAREWVLYITGGVAAPGVYHLPPESRVYHLVDAAGGLTARADRVQINLAMPLADGMHIHVPVEGEASRGPTSHSVPQAPAVPLVSAGAPPDGTVNLNRASRAELEALPGVGPATAEAIVAYRESRGGFASVDELLKVKGIGPKKMEALRKVVSVR